MEDFERATVPSPEGEANPEKELSPGESTIYLEGEEGTFLYMGANGETSYVLRIGKGGPEGEVIEKPSASIRHIPSIDLLNDAVVFSKLNEKDDEEIARRTAERKRRAEGQDQAAA